MSKKSSRQFSNILEENTYLFNNGMPCHVVNFQMTGVSDKSYRNWRRRSSLRAEMSRKSLGRKYSDSALKIRGTEIRGKWDDRRADRCLNGMVPGFFQGQGIQCLLLLSFVD